MDLENMDVTEMFKKRFAMYRKITDEQGEQKAWDTLFQGYPERQKELMGSFIGECSLAEGFSKAIPFYKKMGMDMDVIDISNKGMDAALEIQKVCPVNDIHKEFGFESPCFLICAPDGPAIQEAFPELRATTLCRQADGDCICMFKFERLKG